MNEVNKTEDYTPGRERFLLLGPPGVGKSTLFATLPGKKFAYVFDPNAVASYRRPGIEYLEFYPDEVSVHAAPLASGKDTGPKVPIKEPLAYIEWENHFSKALDNGFFSRYNVIGFDGWTAFQRLVMDRTMWLAGRFGQWPTEGDYAPIVNPILNAARALTALDAIIFTTGHLVERTGKDRGKPDKLSLYTTPIRATLPGLFTDIYRCVPDVDRDNQRHFYVVTAQSRENNYLRCSLPGVAVEEEVTIPDNGWKNPEEFGLGRLLKIAKEKRK